jgi:NAD(P)-dependent dehydrogenase (short-subunit alcohol dehydrogenase family)
MEGNPMKCVLPGIENRVAAVTGGASGIGRQICEFLAMLKARVAVIDVLEDRGAETVGIIGQNGGEAYFTRGDVTDEKEMQRCMEDISRRYGGLDILINNAGIAGLVPFAQLSLEVWRRIIDVNLTGAYICTKAALPYLLSAEKPAVIMVSSGSSLTGSGASASYAASKGGLNALVRALSRELAPRGVRVNGVAPRSIEGELLKSIYPPERLEQMAREIPLGRLGTYEDVSHVVAFLASDLAGFISGETLLVDGGRTFGK